MLRTTLCVLLTGSCLSMTACAPSEPPRLLTRTEVRHVRIPAPLLKCRDDGRPLPPAALTPAERQDPERFRAWADAAETYTVATEQVLAVCEANMDQIIILDATAVPATP